MEQDDGFGGFVWGVAEVVEVTIWAETADDGGAGWGVNGLALRADGDFAVVTDADAGLLAPDVGPPGTVGIGPEDGTFFGEGLVVGGVGCLAEFAVDFVLVGVGHELVEQVVGPDQFHDVVGGQEGGRVVFASSRGGVRFCLWPEALGHKAVGRRSSGGPPQVG